MTAIPLPVGKGAEQEITRKAGRGQTLENIEYLAEGGCPVPCMHTQGQGRSNQEMPPTADGKERILKVESLIERLLKRFRQEEMRMCEELGQKLIEAVGTYERKKSGLTQ